jgi:hypothetical protein
MRDTVYELPGDTCDVLADHAPIARGTRSWYSRVLLACCLAVPAVASAAILEQVAPTPISYVFGTQFRVMSNSGTGDVTAAVTVVDLQLGLGNTSTSGCEASDFAGFTAGNIALIQRGTCFFFTKALNAQAAGAAGAIIFNQGNTPDRVDLVGGDLTDAFALGGGTIPVLALSYTLGEELAGTSGLVMHMVVTEEDVQSAPIPGSLALLCLGLAAFAISRHKRAAQAVK